jgi:hypothetical protein
MLSRLKLLNIFFVAALLAASLPWQPALADAPAAPGAAPLQYTGKLAATRSEALKVIITGSGFPGQRDLVFTARVVGGAKAKIGHQATDKAGTIKFTTHLPASFKNKRNINICAKDRKSGQMTCTRLK